MTDKTERFDQIIVRELEESADRLIKQHREIRSIAIIVDWDLPPSAGASLPVGVWRCQPDGDAFVTTTGMQVQLPKMSHHLGSLLLETVQQLHKQTAIDDTSDKKKEEDNVHKQPSS